MLSVERPLWWTWSGPVSRGGFRYRSHDRDHPLMAHRVITWLSPDRAESPRHPTTPTEGKFYAVGTRSVDLLPDTGPADPGTFHEPVKPRRKVDAKTARIGRVNTSSQVEPRAACCALRGSSVPRFLGSPVIAHRCIRRTTTPRARPRGRVGPGGSRSR